MQLRITSVGYAPSELDEQLPIEIELIRMLPGVDRPDYWLASVKKPVRWLSNNLVREIRYLVVAARWQGTSIGPGVEHLPIGIAYVTDESLLEDARFELKKAYYAAIGVASDTMGGVQTKPSTATKGGTIAPGFGDGKAK